MDNLTSRESRDTTRRQALEVDLVLSQTYKNTNRLTAIICSLCLGSFYFGFSLTSMPNVSPTTLSIYFGPRAGESGVIGGLIGALPIGAALGALVAPLFMRLFSRKNFLLFLNGLAMLVAGVVQINNIYVLLACRLMMGFLIGNYMAIIPIYINELTPAQLQGSFGAFTQLFVVVAVVLCYFLGVLFTETGVEQQFVWRFLFAFPGFTSLLQSVLLICNFIPESPVSLIKNLRFEEAKYVIACFHTSKGFNKAYNDLVIKEGIGSTIPDNEVELTTPSPRPTDQHAAEKFNIPISWRAMVLGFQLPFMQQLSGINMIVTQIGSIVESYDKRMALYAPLIANIIQLIATFASVAALSRFGRKPLLLFGNGALALVDIVIGAMFLVLFVLDWTPSVDVALAFIMVFMVVYGVTIGPVVWLYVPEIIPANLVPLATFMNWAGCTLCIIATPFVVSAVGSPYPVFMFFGIISAIFFVVNCLLIVETKGLTLMQIAQKMQSK